MGNATHDISTIRNITIVFYKLRSVGKIVIIIIIVVVIIIVIIIIITLTIIHHFIVFFLLFGDDWQGYHGLRPGVPYIDPTPDYVLISASESNGYTNLQFERETTTEEDDDPHDVQYRVRNTAFSRKVDGKSASDNPERHCKWF